MDPVAIRRNRSNFWTRKPNAMMAIAVRTQARNVRSFAAWSLYRSIIGRPRRFEKRPYRGRSASETRAANSLG